MQANWSLIINILLLIGVIIAISRMIKARRQQVDLVDYQPSIGATTNTNSDDIIAVRKVSFESTNEEPAIQPVLRPTPQVTTAPIIRSFQEERHSELKSEPTSASLMMFLLAKENRQLAGYELLQTVLSAGLRFGEGHLFHRHQSPNGQGPVLCSLAAATPSGIFDLQNIGAFSVHGLCLFMHASGNPTIDAERFAIMLDTAKQLSEGLDTYLLDEKRQPLSDASIQRYYRQLKLGEVCDAM
jgi:cell division protein ZipA